MTAHPLRFHQRHLGAAILAAAMALALSACSSSGQQAAPAGTPAATASTKGGAPTAPAAPAAKFAAYTAAVPATPANTQCALDTVNAKSAADAAPLAAGSDVVFGGWAGNGKGQAANGFLLVMKGAQSYSMPVATTVARADVAKALSSDGMANSGFNLSASLAGVAAGSYTVYFADPANLANVCATGRNLTVQ